MTVGIYKVNVNGVFINTVLQALSYSLELSFDGSKPNIGLVETSAWMLASFSTSEK